MRNFQVTNADSFRKWRAKAGWTQADAAERFNVSRSTIQNWENGVTPIPTAVSAMCDLWTRELKKQDAEYGPVNLIYANGRIMRAPYSTEPIAMIRSETFANMGEALRRVDELWGRPDFHSPQITDERETLWNVIELTRRADERRPPRSR